jgi:hypothetical protein
MKKSSGDHSGNPFFENEKHHCFSSIFLLPRTNLCFYLIQVVRGIVLWKNKKIKFFGAHESILKKNKNCIIGIKTLSWDKIKWISSADVGKPNAQFFYGFIHLFILFFKTRLLRKIFITIKKEKSTIIFSDSEWKKGLSIFLFNKKWSDKCLESSSFGFRMF